MLPRAALRLGRPGRVRPFSSGGGGSGGGGPPADELLGSLPLAFPSVCIWGSNTGVGKTLFSAGLAAACRRAGLSVLFLKPVQTGFPTDSDARLVAAAASLPLVTGPHAAYLESPQQQEHQQQQVAARSGSSSDSSSGSSRGGSLAKTLYAWQQPVSPHVAVETEGRPVSDRQVAAAVAAELRAFAAAGMASSSSGGSGSGGSSSGGSGGQRVAIVETAGGVASPGPSGSLQCDLLRTLRLPGILVGDGRLGGISATLAAHDTLALRGHQVPLVVLMEEGRLGNAAAIRKHLRGRAHVLAFPECLPPPLPVSACQQEPLPAGGIDANLAAWLDASAPQFDSLLSLAAAEHRDRVAKLAAAAGEARAMLWWPFTQHGSVAGDAGVTVIDSRVGESFCVYRPATPAAAGEASGGATGSGSPEAGMSSTSGEGGGSLELMYDACASWWTQGVGERAQSELVRSVAAAAARYGHVMFPENAHEPAVELARLVLGSAGAGWASRVFYTDNGSTAIEVALKMAFRKYMVDHGLMDSQADLQVLGLTEGYHGDTLGAMDAVAPSLFNGRLQTPWYTGRGLFLEPPLVAVKDGRWRVQLPDDMAAAAAEAGGKEPAGSGSVGFGLDVEFSSHEGVFAVPQRMQAPLYRLYCSHIASQLEQYSQQYSNGSTSGTRNSSGEVMQGGVGSSATPQAKKQEQQQQQQRERRLGALILEPVLQGAGGMRLVDPLYQRALVDTCREAGIPVIFDEVFTGFYRLGATTGASLLGASPDIACYAKLLTGGLVPLSVTLATEEVFNAFKGDKKVEALLHGHSYTAHPIGCAAGVASLQLLTDPAMNPNICTPVEPGRCRKQQQQQQQQQQGSKGSGSKDSGAGCACSAPCGRLLPLWDEASVAALSCHPAVKGVVPLGTVLAVQLQQEGAGGYASDAAAAVVRRLRSAGLFARPLGDVVYLMVTPATERAQCDALMAKLVAALG